MDLEALLRSLNASAGGLSEEEAQTRLRRFGPNKLPEHAAPGLGQIVLRQFYNPLIYILVIAALVSVFKRAQS